MAKYNKLYGKHVLVIGGSAGIGHAVAAASLESDAQVTISSSSEKRLAAAVSALKLSTGVDAVRVSGITCDLSSPETIEANLEALFQSAKQLAPVDHVVYTAADAIPIAGLADVTPAQVHAAVQMRMVAPLMVAKVAARHLPRTRASSVTFTGGTISERPEKGWAVTAYLGGGVQSLVKVLALEMAPVRVNLVRPGVVDTGIWDTLGPEAKQGLIDAIGAKVPTGQAGQVEDVAEAYLWLMKDGNASGSVAGTDGGALLV